MKKLLILMLAVGMVCLAGAAFAQNNANPDDVDNGGANQTTQDVGVQVTNPNLLGSTQGSGDGNANMDGDNGVQVNVPDANIAGADANGDDSIAVDADAAAQDESVAQKGETNVNVPDPQVALSGKQAATGDASNSDESASALLAKQVGSDGATNTDDSANALGSANSGNNDVAQTAASANNGDKDVAQTGETNVNVPDATVQALGKNMADDGGTVTDKSANALGAAASEDSEAINQAHATIPVFIVGAEDGGVGTTDGEATFSKSLPFDPGTSDDFNQADNAATGGSTAMGGVDNNNTLITDPEVALGGKMAATGTGTNQDNSINNFGASQATGASSSVGFQTPITNVYPPDMYAGGVATSQLNDGSILPIGPLGSGGTTQVGAAGGSMAFGGYEDTGVIGSGNITQGGSENVNMNNISNSPVQYRETNGSTGVAMDGSTANTTTGENSPIATDQGVSQGGEHNVNVAVTDPALQFGNANSYANNGATSAAVGDESALAVGDYGIAQTGQTNMSNLTSSPVQVRNANDNYGAMAMDSGMAQKGFINSQAQNDAQSQVGLLNAQAKDTGIAQSGLNNMNNVSGSPVQIRGTEVDDGAVAMDSGVAFGKNDGGQQSYNGNNQYIGDDASGVQGNDNAKGINFTQNVTPSSSQPDQVWTRSQTQGKDGGSAVDPSVVQADVGAIDSDHIQGGYDNQNAMDNGMNLKDVDDSAVSYNGNAMTQDVGDESIGNQVVAGDNSPVQVRSLGEVEDSALAMDSGKAQNISDESIGVQSMDTGVSQLGLTNNNGAGNAQSGLTNANSGQAQTGLVNTQANSGTAQTGVTNANSGVAMTGLANNNGGATTNGQLVWNGGVGIQAGDSSPVQNRDTEAKDYSVVTMDSGVSLGGKENFNTYAGDNSPVQARYNDVDDGSAVAQDSGIAISHPDDSPVAINGSKAIGSVNDESAVGMDSARVVSDPNDSAIAQGDGSIALNDTEHFAVSTGNYSPAIQDANDVAFVGAGNSAQDFSNSTFTQGPGMTNSTQSGPANGNQGSGMANQSNGAPVVATQGSGQSAYQSGTYNNAVQGNGQAVNNSGSAAVSQQGDAMYNNSTGAQSKSGNAQSVTGGAVPVAANQGSGVANNGIQGQATYTDNAALTVNSNIGANTGNPPPTLIQGIQTVAVTQLKQVNAGVNVGNNNSMYGAGAQVNANSSGSATTGVYSSSGSIGVASNSSSMNVVNVTANVTQSHP